MAVQFDAFISYARRASTDEAAALKRGIEQYNRKWNEARSSRVFVDDSSMSASSSLEETITDALAGSRWLIVLLSEAAAQSPWVNRELSWWLDNRDAEHLLLVHDDGVAAWEGTDFSPGSTAIPPALRGRLASEPRWVDMQWFDAPDSLGAQDPRFIELIMQLYCPVHGIDREEAATQQNANVRRAKRLARAAISTLSVLLVLALVAGGLALQQRNTAIEQSRIAMAKQFAAQSQQIRTTDVGTSRLLALQAWSMFDDPQTRSAMLGSLLASPYLSGQLRVDGSVTALAASSDGTLAYVGLATGEVLRWFPTEHRSDQLGKLVDSVAELATSTDGRTVIARSLHSAVGWHDGQPLELGLDSPASVALSPSGRSIAAVDVHEGEGGHDDTAELRLWGLDPAGTLSAGTEVQLKGVPSDIRLPNDNELVERGGLPDLEVKRLRLPSLALVGRIVYSSTPYRGFEPYLAPDGATLYDGWTVIRTDQLDSTATSEQPTQGIAPGDVDYLDLNATALSHGGDFFLTQHAGRLTVSKLDWTSAKASVIATLTGSLNFEELDMPSSSILLSADQGLVTLWDLGRRSAIMASSPLDIGVKACNGCGEALVEANQDGSALALWAETSVPVSGQDFPSDGVTIVRRSGQVVARLPDRRLLAWRDSEHVFLGSDVGVEIYNITSGRTDQTWPLPGWEKEIVTSHWDGAAGLLTAASSDHIFTLSPDGGTQPTVQLPQLEVVEISADGSLVICRTEVDDEWTYLVFTSTDLAEPLLSAPHPLAFVGDHGVMETDDRGAVLDASGGSPSLRLPGSAYYGLAVSSDSEYILSHSVVGAVQVQARSSGTEIGSFPLAEVRLGPSVVTFSGDSSTAVAMTGEEEGSTSTLIFYDLRPVSWKAEICATVGRSISAGELQQLTGQVIDLPLACA